MVAGREAGGMAASAAGSAADRGSSLILKGDQKA